MAKSKSTNSTKPASTTSAKRKASVASNGRTSASTTKSATGTQAVISAAEIGQVAGDVWGLLSRDGGRTLSAIKKSIDAPADVVAAAIGWLAREDKLDFSTSGRQVKISLR